MKTGQAKCKATDNRRPWERTQTGGPPGPDEGHRPSFPDQRSTNISEGMAKVTMCPARQERLRHTGLSLCHQEAFPSDAVVLGLGRPSQTPGDGETFQNTRVPRPAPDLLNHLRIQGLVHILFK